MLESFAPRLPELGHSIRDLGIPSLLKERKEVRRGDEQRFQVSDPDQVLAQRCVLRLSRRVDDGIERSVVEWVTRLQAVVHQLGEARLPASLLGLVAAENEVLVVERTLLVFELRAQDFGEGAEE